MPLHPRDLTNHWSDAAHTTVHTQGVAESECRRGCDAAEAAYAAAWAAGGAVAAEEAELEARHQVGGEGGRGGVGWGCIHDWLGSGRRGWGGVMCTSPTK